LPVAHDAARDVVAVPGPVVPMAAAPVAAAVAEVAAAGVDPVMTAAALSSSFALPAAASCHRSAPFAALVAVLLTCRCQ
jgi:hypothetical protein